MKLVNFSYCVAAMMVIFVLVLLYGAVISWKIRSKFMSVIFVLLSGVLGYATYSLYGEMIAKLFM